MIERSRVLTGRCREGAWSLRLRRPTSGGPAQVEIDWAWALQREEARGDVVGFFHTHPRGSAAPSSRDRSTMRAWVSCFGKPLLCVIEAEGALAVYLFASDEDEGRPMPWVERRGPWLAVGMEPKEPEDERAFLP
jgi:hypothetical protein